MTCKGLYFDELEGMIAQRNALNEASHGRSVEILSTAVPVRKNKSNGRYFVRKQ